MGWLLTALACWGGSPAWATPPTGATLHPTGLWRLPWGQAPAGAVAWIDAQNRAVVNLGTGAGFRCVDYAQTPPVVGAALPAQGSPLAVAAGRDAAFLVQTVNTTMTIWRIDCGATSTVVGTGTLDAKYLSANAIQHPIAAEPDGTVYLATMEGIIKFGPGPGGAWAVTDVESYASLDAPLRASLPRPVPDSDWSNLVFDTYGLTTPDGSLWLEIFPTHANVPSITGGALYRLAPGAPLQMVSGLSRQTNIPLVWDQATNAVVASDGTFSVRGTRTSHVAFIPVGSRQALPADQQPPWPRASELVGPRTPTSGHFVPTGDGRLVAVTTRGFETFGVDADLADFDGDGLLAGEEATQGTSDLVADSDSDGVLDGREVHALASDPRDAGSGPVPEAQRIRAGFGPSTRIATWSWPDLGWTLPADASGQAICKATQFVGSGLIKEPRGYNCMDVEGKLARDTHLMGIPGLTPDGRFVFTNGLADFSWWDRTTGESSSFPAPLYRYVWAFRRDLAFGDYAPRLTRYDAQGHVFQVFDEGRPCRVAGTAAQGQQCKGPLSDPTLFAMQVVGYDQDQQKLFLAVTSQHQEFLATVGDGEVEFVMGAGQFKDGVLPRSIRRWPGHPGYVTWSKGEPYVLRDENFVPVQRGFVEANALDGYFRGGFVVRESAGMWLPTEQVSGPDCKSSEGELPLCTGVYNPGSFEVRYVTQFAQWVPVPLELEPGESLLWAAGLRRNEGDTGSIDFRTLWRVTRAGAIIPWLPPEALVALADAAGQASLAANGWDVRGVAVSPDLRHVCLAEPSQKRLWELELDAQRRPTRLVLIDATQTVGACAYRPDNGLVKLIDDQGQVRVLDPQSSTTLPGLGQPLGLARYAGGAIAWGATGKAVCVRDSGTVQVAARAALALAVSGARVAWVDDAGRAGIQGVEDFCGGGLSGEPLIFEGSDRVARWAYDLWSYLYSRTGQTSFAMAPGAGMILPEPSGDWLVSALNPVHVGVPAGQADQVYRWLFRLRPTYAPLATAGRDVTLDPLRRETGVVTWASFHVTSVSCGATVPGDAVLLPDDWAQLGAPPPVDAGVPDAGTAGPTPTVPPPPKIEPLGPCGCSSPGGPALLWLALIAARAVTRKQRGTSRT